MIGTWTVEIPSWGSANLLEILWLSSGVLAVFYCLRHLPALVDDYMLTLALKEDRPQLRIAARGNMRRECVRLIIGSSITGLGIYSVLQPAIVPGPVRISFVGLLLTGVLLLISFSTALLSAWDWHDRLAIQGLLELGFGYENGKHETEG